MIKNKIKLASLITIPISAMTISCTYYGNKDKLLLYIDKSKDVMPLSIDYKEKRTQENIDQLIKATFPSEEKKIEYLNKFKNPKYLKQMKDKFSSFFKEYKEIKKNNNPDGIDRLVSEMKDFYNENWYYILTNLDKFELVFYKWLAFPDYKDGKHSDEYKNRIENMSIEYDDLKKIQMHDNYLGTMIEGDESAELSNKTIYYLAKKNLVFRISINDITTEQPTMQFNPYVWGFPYITNRDVSLKLITDLVHSAYIHRFQDGFDRFEKDMVENLRYGVPGIFLLMYKGGE
ncbi:aromatic motif membrane protein [Mycoplasmopsis adleri]|uniref:aromatic motif membrane protein n=1 Tax=Mycoplasmopsis adleri TaxID=51362 RepID=UPI0038735323